MGGERHLSRAISSRVCGSGRLSASLWNGTSGCGLRTPAGVASPSLARYKMILLSARNRCDLFCKNMEFKAISVILSEFNTV